MLPPSQEELLKIRTFVSKGNVYKSHEKKSEWADDYLRAKSFPDSALACAKYLSLSKEDLFPLKSLAFIGSLNNCIFTKTELDHLWEREEKNIPNWALEDYFETSLNLAIKNNDLPKMAYFKARLSEYQPHRQGKEEYLLQAIKWDKKSEYLQMLYKIAPRFSPSDLKENLFPAGLDFERVRDFERARSIYKKLIDGREFSFKEKVLAFNQLALSYKKERNQEKFVEKIKEMMKWLNRFKQTDEVQNAMARNQIDLARAIWTEQRRDEGEKILKSLILSYNKNPNYLAEAYWVLGMMSIEKKDLEAALPWFEKGANLSISDLELKDKINWVIGWNYYLLKNFKKAVLTFENYEKKTENFNLQLKMKYWKAISLKKSNKNALYKKELAEILNLNPISYYGILAQKELNIPFTPLDKNAPTINLNDPTFEWLYAMGEEKACRNFLKEYVQKLKDPDKIKNSVGLFYKINWYKEGINQFNKIEPQERFALHKNQLPFIFPRPFEKEVMDSAEKFNIQDSLVYSIARQESGFDQYARSWADAFGLMQVTPEVAKKMAKQFNIKYKAASDLYNPKLNIELGTAIIKDLINRFQNDYVLIVGSYNANYKSVANWKKERFNGDYLEFIELIPYEETQNFVKLVTRNFFLYKRLNSKKEFLFPKNFFESI